MEIGNITDIDSAAGRASPRADGAASRLRVLITLMVLITAEASRAENAVPSNSWIQTWTEIEALADDGTPESARELERIYANTNAPWAQGRALVALAGLGHPEIAKHATQSATSPHPLLRAAAYEALAILGGDDAQQALRSGLADTDPSARWQAGIGLAKAAGDAAEAELDSMVREATSNAAPHQVAILGQLGTDAALDKLVALATHKDDGIRLRSLTAMHEIRDPRIVPVLVERAHGDRKPDLRAVARGVLGSYPADFLAKPLAELFRTGSPAHVLIAIQILFDRPSQAGADALAQMLRENLDQHPKALILLAMDTLLAIDPQRYQDVFTQRMEDKDPMIRIRALLALSAGATQPDLYALLKDPLDDSDDRVFRRAIGMLERQTSDAPDDGLLPYLAPVLNHSKAERVRAGLHVLKKRIPAEEIESAIDALGSHLRGTNHVLRAAAADIFTLAISDEVVRASGAAQGYLTHWMVLGPFDNDRFNVGYDAVYPPEQEVDFAASYDGATSPARMADELPGGFEKPSTNGTIRVKWEPWRVTSLDSRLHLNRTMLGAPEYIVSYAVAQFISGENQTAHVQIVADDSFKAWLNGTLIASAADEPISQKVADDRESWRAVVRTWRDHPHSATAEDVALKQGRNQLLVKVCNYTDLWYLRVRLANAQGGRADFEEIDVEER